MFTFGMAQLKKRVHVHQAHAKEEEEGQGGGLHGLFGRAFIAFSQL